MILYIILNPKQCINFTITGTKLFFYSVFPSLFPFLVIINLILVFGGIEIYSKLLGTILCKPLGLPKQCSVVILASVFCGYPLGAKYSCELYERNLIDKYTFQRLLNIASNGSPLFIIGTVGTAMLQNSNFGYILIAANILSCITMGIILPRKNFKYDHISKLDNRSNTNNLNLGIALKNALEEAVKTCISIGSFVIIFSVLINIIKSSEIYSTAIYHICNKLSMPTSAIDGTILGIIEVTNGCNILSSTQLSSSWKLILCSFLIGFGGLSINSQVYSFIYKYKISMKKYISLKFFQGIINSIITFGLIQLPILGIYQETFTSTKLSSFNIPNIYLFVTLIFILVLPILLKNIKKLFSIS